MQKNKVNRQLSAIARLEAERDAYIARREAALLRDVTDRQGNAGCLLGKIQNVEFRINDSKRAMNAKPKLDSFALEHEKQSPQLVATEAEWMSTSKAG